MQINLSNSPKWSKRTVCFDGHCAQMPRSSWWTSRRHAILSNKDKWIVKTWHFKADLNAMYVLTYILPPKWRQQKEKLIKIYILQSIVMDEIHLEHLEMINDIVPNITF